MEKPGHIYFWRSGSGTMGSGMEHGIIEQFYGVEAISAVKAIHLANAQGLKTYQVTSANLATVLPVLQVSNAVKTDITNAVNAGKEVTIPEQELVVNDWTGIGYIVSDATTGAGAYIISGGIGGANNVFAQGLDEVQDKSINWPLVVSCLLTDENSEIIVRALLALLAMPIIIPLLGKVGFVIGAALMIIIIGFTIAICVLASRNARLKRKRDQLIAGLISSPNKSDGKIYTQVRFVR